MNKKPISRYSVLCFVLYIISITTAMLRLFKKPTGSIFLLLLFLFVVDSNAERNNALIMSIYH